MNIGAMPAFAVPVFSGSAASVVGAKAVPSILEQSRENARCIGDAAGPAHQRRSSKLSDQEVPLEPHQERTPVVSRLLTAIYLAIHRTVIIAIVL